MDERATGIIVRTRPLTESSLIVQWLTAEHGRIATVAKGARRPKSPFRGKLDLFYTADFSFARSRRSDLHTLREINLQETHAPLRADYHKLEQAAYAVALIEQTTETDTPLPELHALLLELLNHLAHHPTATETVLAFELKVLHTLGLQPDTEATTRTEGARLLLKKFAEEDWAWIARIKASDAQLREMAQFLHGFLIYHLERFPKSRAGALGI